MIGFGLFDHFGGLLVRFLAGACYILSSRIFSFVSFHNGRNDIPMKRRPREDQILRELRRKGNLSLDELIADLGASAASVRRDLTKLEARGLVRRTHGGVTLVEPLLYEPFRYDSLFQNREQHRPAEKRKIGLAASGLICENETVGFTAGTTTTHAARN